MFSQLFVQPSMTGWHDVLDVLVVVRGLEVETGGNLQPPRASAAEQSFVLEVSIYLFIHWIFLLPIGTRVPSVCPPPHSTRQERGYLIDLWFGPHLQESGGPPL